MRILKNILVILLLTMTLYSCNKNEKVKVAFMLPHTKLERYVKEKTYFEGKINELGGEFYFASAEYDAALQIKQAKEFIEQGVKAIVISPVNSNLAGEIVRMAHENNATIISYDRLINNAQVDYYITFRYQKIGKNMISYCSKLRQNGKIIILGGDKTDFNANQIDIGQKEELEPLLKNGSIKILYKTFVEEWRTENANNIMNYYLQLTNNIPDIIICSSDRIATGVITSLKDHNLSGNVLVSGMDPDKETYKRLLSGDQTMSVYKPFKQISQKAAEFGFKCATKAKLETISETMNNGLLDVPTVFLEPIVVDKANIKSTLLADGYYTENDI